MRLDLHTHSTASDGQYTPRELLVKAEERGLELFAISDHDTVDGITEAKEASKEHAFQFVPGIEISSMDGAGRWKEELHILGLGIDEKNEGLLQKCKEFEEERLGRGQRVCTFLEKQGVSVDWEEILEIAGNGSVGRPHFAEYLQKHGYVKERKSAFQQYLDTPAFHRATDRVLPTPKEAIELIHQAGGVAVLAHPGLLKAGGWEFEDLLKNLISFGLDGMECIYPRHNSKQVQNFLHLAEVYKLGITAGSDFHGELIKPDISLGMEIQEDAVAKMLINL